MAKKKKPRNRTKAEETKVEEKSEKFALSSRAKLLVILLVVAIIVGVFWKRAYCYENKMDEGFVEKTRLEIIIDYYNGKEYEVIEW